MSDGRARSHFPPSRCWFRRGIRARSDGRSPGLEDSPRAETMRRATRMDGGRTLSARAPTAAEHAAEALTANDMVASCGRNYTRTRESAGARGRASKGSRRSPGRDADARARVRRDVEDLCARTNSHSSPRGRGVRDATPREECKYRSRQSERAPRGRVRPAADRPSHSKPNRKTMRGVGSLGHVGRAPLARATHRAAPSPYPRSG